MGINSYIDYTNLDITATLRDIEKLCDTAIKNHYNAVCVHPYYISLASSLLKNSNVLVDTVVGYPMGVNTMESKVYEAIDAIEKGADEIDMVINLSALKNKEYEYIKEEIEEIRDAIDGKVLKIVIDDNVLTDKEIIKIIEICNETFVNYIQIGIDYKIKVNKKSIELVKKYKSDILEIKINGKVDNIEEVEDYIKLGINKIGTNKNILEN